MFKALLVGLAAVVLGGCASAPRTVQRFEYTRPQMGLPFRIVLYAGDRLSADAAAEAAFARVQQLNDILSDYDTDSELSRLNQTAGSGRAVPVSEDLWQVLARSQQVARETGGAFDITCGPVVSLWRKARREKQLPDPAKLSEALRAVGHEKLRLNNGDRSAQLLVPYMRLDLGALAKGYAIDEAMKVLRARGIRSALITGSGDMAMSGPPPGTSGWRIELAPLDASNAPPARFVLLRDTGFATSGDMFQHVEIQGVRYSHIVNPRTGLGLTDHSLVAVVARDCVTANSVSTSAGVLGPEKGLRFAQSKGACLRFARQPADQVELYQSPCFERYLVR